MTRRGWHRQQLLWTIRQWLRRNGAFFIFIFCFSIQSAGTTMAAETKLVDVLAAASKVKAKATEVKAAVPAAPGASVLISKKTPAEPTKSPKVPEKKEEKKKDEKTVDKTVAGTVSFIRKNKMNVEFKEGEEIVMTIDPDVRINGAKKFSDIAQGDKVSVQYTETFRDPKEPGGEKFVISMTVREIDLVKKARKASELVSEQKDL